MKFESKYKTFHSSKCIWKCRLQKCQPFCISLSMLNGSKWIWQLHWKPAHSITEKHLWDREWWIATVIAVRFNIKTSWQNTEVVIAVTKTILMITKKPTGCQLPDIIGRVYLTHWGRVTHICVNKLTIIGSDNGLSPGRRQAIIWTNAGILFIGPWGTNFSDILIGIHTFSFKKNAFENVVWKMAAILSQPQCVNGVCHRYDVK